MPRAVDGMTQAEVDRMQAGINADPEIQAILKREREQLAATRDQGGDARKYQTSIVNQITAIAKAKGYLPSKGQYFVNPNDGQLEPHGGWAGLSKKTKFAIIAGASIAGGYGLYAAGAFGGAAGGGAAAGTAGSSAAAGGTAAGTAAAAGGFGISDALMLGSLGYSFLSGLRGSGGSSSTTPTMPPPPSLLGGDAESAAVARAAAMKARTRAIGDGRRSTILTGSLGLAPGSVKRTSGAPTMLGRVA